MSRKVKSNLESRSQIKNPCDLSNLDSWFRDEITAISEQVVRTILLNVYENLDFFVKWPEEALLLWEGCDRNKKYHKYPESIRNVAFQCKVTLDGRVNGPAVAAYCVAGGVRPERWGSRNAWSIHHIYSGKFPHLCRSSSESYTVRTTHAAYDGFHCTQSAGLVAIHPVADQICDEYPFFAWLLRAKSFKRFSYDPDHVFSKEKHNTYGFAGEDFYGTPICPRVVFRPVINQTTHDPHSMKGMA